LESDLFTSESVIYKNKSLSGFGYANSIILQDLDYVVRRNILTAIRNKTPEKRYPLSASLLFEQNNIPDYQIRRLEVLIKNADSKKVISKDIKDKIKSEFRDLKTWNKTIKRKSKQDLKKKIRNKVFSFEIALNLALSNPNSKLYKSYLNTINFCQSLYQQDGYKITSRYCNCRHCYSCNRIRSGKLINSYNPLVEVMDDKHLVTLTIKNVKAENLRDSIIEMKENFKLIKDVLRKRKTPFLGLRKLECTYNQIQDTYHPHFHILVNGESAANELHNLWLQYNPGTSELGQDVRKADNKSVKELFKYFTKFWSKKKNNTETIIDYKAQDVIYNSIANIRIFQSFGITKKIKDKMKVEIDESEDIDPSENSYFNINPDEDTFYYNPADHSYISPDTGSEIINYKMSKKDIKLFADFNRSILWDEKKIREKKELIDPLITCIDAKYMQDLIPILQPN